MGGSMHWLFPTTSLGAILRTRPLALSVFESHGLSPWKDLTASIECACRLQGLPTETLSWEIGGLQAPAAESDWSRLSIYHLLDFLTEEHRVFRDFLASITYTLNTDPLEDLESRMFHANLSRDWRTFYGSFLEHLREEEEFLFPKILRYHASLRDGNIDPEFGNGSVRVFKAVRMGRREQGEIEIYRKLLERSWPAAGGEKPLCPSETRLRPLLEAFLAKLESHANLETEALFPAATAMEKTLYDRHIRGTTHVQA